MGHYDDIRNVYEEEQRKINLQKEIAYRKLLVEKLNLLISHVEESYQIIDDREAIYNSRAPTKYRSFLKEKLNYKLYDLLLTVKGLKSEIEETND